MKRIAIITIISENYGNRLQNFALQKTLENMKYNVSTLSNLSKEEKNKVQLRNHAYLQNNGIIACIYLTLKKQVKSILGIENKFSLFDDHYIHQKDDYISVKEMTVGLAKKYDVFIVGSDQIWNTNFDFISINSFLPFEHPRKISFSASFGVDSIPFNQQIVDCLNDFKALSVREEAGARIIKELTGRDATVLVDPTMLLTKDEWRKVSRKPRGAKEGYILTYFLSPKCDKAKTKLKEIREDKEVYELLNPSDKVAGTAGPSEFLWLFDHADIILTDSFHACVFSFLFNKPFIVYDRNWDGGNMNSRLETLLSKFSLERKYASFGIENDTWEHDYTKGYKQLEIERKKAIDFLKKALED